MNERLVYDIGMHKGEDSAFYLAKGYEVVGFEANPELAEACRMRFTEENGVRIVEGAVAGAEQATVRFYRHPASVWGTIYPEWARRNSAFAESTPVEVDVVDFAAILEEAGMPGYMKVDIEGADMLCLRALAEFEERPRYVSLESTKTDWQALLTELSVLEQLGYTRFAVVQQADIPGSEIVTETLAGEPLRYRFEAGASGPFGSDLDGWTDRAGAEERYRGIFRRYRLLGDRSPLRRTKLGREALIRLGRRFKPLPGWYDTHAARE